MKSNRPSLLSGKRIAFFSVLFVLLVISIVFQRQDFDPPVYDQSPSTTELDADGTGNNGNTDDTSDTSDNNNSNSIDNTGTDNDFTTDYFTVLGPAVIEYNPAPGEVAYCPLDALNRATCAYGSLTPLVREDAQRRGRQNINIDPAGWPRNTEVLIDALSDVEGSKSYSGWLWNRSHLLADSLGGDAIRENLVTGTRTQNVGSTQRAGQYSGGMAFTELTARDWLDAQSDGSCPLYYAATPIYTGDELVPRTVLVDVQSCNQEINMRVEVSNTANGWSIDYANGSYEKE